MQAWKRSLRCVRVKQGKRRSCYFTWRIFSSIQTAFQVFNYLTRVILAALTALMLCLWLGPWVIRRLVEGQIGQAVRDDGLVASFKAGTPTMGGAMILLAIAISTLLWGDLTNYYVWIVLLVTLGFGAIEWVDDYHKVVEKNPRGLPARWVHGSRWLVLVPQ